MDIIDQVFLFPKSTLISSYIVQNGQFRLLSDIRSYLPVLYQAICKINKSHDDLIKWKHFPRNWPFVRGIHRSRWIPHTKASDAVLMFSLICVWINVWVNNREAGDLRRYRAYYDVIVMQLVEQSPYLPIWCLVIPTRVFAWSLWAPKEAESGLRFSRQLRPLCLADIWAALPDGHSGGRQKNYRGDLSIVSGNQLVIATRSSRGCVGATPNRRWFGSWGVGTGSVRFNLDNECLWKQRKNDINDVIIRREIDALLWQA